MQISIIASICIGALLVFVAGIVTGMLLVLHSPKIYIGAGGGTGKSEDPAYRS